MSSTDSVPVGLAKIDVTPVHPIRLSGYGVRREETAQVETRLWARAMAIGADRPAVLIALENVGVTEAFTEGIAARLNHQAGVERPRFSLSYSHTHTGPFLTNAAPMLFSTDIPAEHQAHIDQYTNDLSDKLVTVSLAALADRKPGILSYTQGSAGFAANRRSQVGPVDHVMPLLRVTDPDGQLRALWASYACHCTTLGGADNFLCGDWAGYAQDAIEQDHPGVVGMVSIGCAADANPYPRHGLDYARQHGTDIACEVNRLLSGSLRPVSGELDCRLSYIDLPFDRLPTRDEWIAKVASGGSGSYHASKWLERLDRGETIPTHQRYPVQTWAFGDDLVIVFLASEVVADFPLRLRRMYDPARLWVGAYNNAFPGYIPSHRVWHEGGYEGGDATIYFGMPARYTDEVEDRVIAAVERLVPDHFRRT